MVSTLSSMRKFYFLFLSFPLLALADPNNIPVHGLRASSTSISSPAPSVAAAGCSDNGSVIDVMVVYSEEAVCGHSGLRSWCNAAENEAPIRAHVERAVLDTNRAFENSGVMTEFRLVYTRIMFGYKENKDFGSILVELSTVDDRVMDRVHRWRRKYGADMVVMIVDNDNANGAAYTTHGGVSATRAFSVVNREAAVAGYTFAHETAHNLGASHDRLQYDGGVAGGDPEGYGYGWVDPGNKFRTIMARGEPPRIQMFSNTVTQYEGMAAGDKENDVALAINSSRAKIAGYYQCKSFPTVSTPRTRLGAGLLGQKASLVRTDH